MIEIVANLCFPGVFCEILIIEDPDDQIIEFLLNFGTTYLVFELNKVDALLKNVNSKKF